MYALTVSLTLHALVLVGLVYVKTPESTNLNSPMLRYSLFSINNLEGNSVADTNDEISTAINAIVVTDPIGVEGAGEEDDSGKTAIATMVDEPTFPPHAPQERIRSDTPQLATVQPATQESQTEYAREQGSRIDRDSSNQATNESDSSRISDSLAISAFVEQRNADVDARGTGYSASMQNQSLAAQRYIQAFTQKVQRIGQLNYPEEAASRKLHGELALEIAIDANGRVLSINVISSSGHEELDLAAVGIIKLAAPYAPLPQSLRNAKNRLEFVQKWSFRGQRFALE